MSMEKKQGICLECCKPLTNQKSYGYHSGCAEIAHKREEDRVNKEFPFVLVGSDGNDIERFKTMSEAEDYFFNVRYASIEER